MTRRVLVLPTFLIVTATGFGCGGGDESLSDTLAAAGGGIDAQLHSALDAAGFTGQVGISLESRLGRAGDPQLADLGRLLWFDKIHSLKQDNTCAGCHSPTNGFGDTQSIAYGVNNNNLVGPNRDADRNQRRSPLVVNTVFFPKLMWNGRFFTVSGDPFDNSGGFVFPDPEGATRFPPNDPINRVLLQAQAHIPPTELVEVAGFQGTAGTISPEFDQFDDGIGIPVPLPDSSGFRNEPIRQRGLQELNGNANYRALFGALFPDVASGGPINFNHFGLAIAEFEFSLTFANAPIDKFARGQNNAMTAAEKRGALLFFGKAKCVQCHAVAGEANEMFSDFQNRTIGVPQIAPFFGAGTSNMIYDGPGRDEDFGAEQISGDMKDRYKFRTAPLRNIKLAPAFMHNGCYTRLEDAIRHHLDPYTAARNYDPVAAGIDEDLTHRLGPIEPVLHRLDPILKKGINLTNSEVADLVAFVGDGLLDGRATRDELCQLVPAVLPSGLTPLEFEQCE